MRVLHTESSINMGGQELRILEQIQWLNNNGHSAWLAARRDAAIFSEAQRRNIPCHHVPFRGSLNPVAMFGLRRLATDLRVDLIDAHSERDASNALLCHCTGIPVVRTLHMDKKLKSDCAHRLLWTRASRAVIATSASIKVRLEVLAVESARIHIVGEGVDEAEFHPAVDAAAVRQRHGIAEDAFVLVQVGMIRPDKGQTVSVRAMARILEKIPHAWLLLVGGATREDYGTRLQREIDSSPAAHRIVCTGFRKDVAAYMAAADVVVLASTGVEAQSRVVPQAFLMKRPVVASSVGGVPELVQDGANGLLFPPGAVEQLAAQVVRLIENPELRNTLTENGHAYGKVNLTQEVMMHRTLEVYDSILKNRSKR